VRRGLRRREAPPAALLAALLALSACATAATSGGAGEGGAAPAQTAQAEGEKPGAAGPAAKPAQRPATVERPWAGAFSPLATIGYIPLKAIPCSLGTFGAVVGFLFTFDSAMLRDTITLNCGGDWVITPGMLVGQDPMRSVGRVETAPGQPPPPHPAIPPINAIPPLREPGAEY
jgi:hypothetical protein